MKKFKMLFLLLAVVLGFGFSKEAKAWTRSEDLATVTRRDVYVYNSPSMNTGGYTMKYQTRVLPRKFVGGNSLLVQIGNPNNSNTYGYVDVRGLAYNVVVKQKAAVRTLPSLEWGMIMDRLGQGTPVLAATQRFGDTQTWRQIYYGTHVERYISNFDLKPGKG